MSSIHDLPSEERPRERLLQSGSESLSISELLAILLGNGTRGKSVLHMAQEILSRFQTLERLSHASVEELCQIRGIGKAKAILLQAAFCIGRRLCAQIQDPSLPITTPLQAYHFARKALQNEIQEQFLVLLLDTKGKLIRTEIVAMGSLSLSAVHAREVFYPAIRHKAASIILAHNHPSGDPSPSPEDINITQHLIKAGKLLDLKIQDHIIIGKHEFCSLKERGLFSINEGPI